MGLMSSRYHRQYVYETRPVNFELEANGHQHGMKNNLKNNLKDNLKNGKIQM